MLIFIEQISQSTFQIWSSYFPLNVQAPPPPPQKKKKKKKIAKWQAITII